MVVSRTCRSLSASGDGCRAAPRRDGEYCLWHDPEQADLVAEARRLGGVRRKRETTIAGAYEVDGLDTVAAIRRVIEIVTLDALGMESTSVARGRLLIAAMQAATKLLETGELEDRVERIEAVLGPKLEKGRRR